MELLPVRRKSCLLRPRIHCPFRRLRRQTHAVSAGASSAIGSVWNNVGPPPNNQHFPSVSGGYNQSAAAADVHMEEDPQNQQNQKNPENEFDDDIDPETGERAQG